MSECASCRSVPSRSRSTISSQPSTGGCERYHPKVAHPSTTAGATKTVAKAALGQKRLRLLGHVDEPVVEAETDRPAARSLLVEQLRGLDDVDDAVGLGGEVVHLPPEVARADGELVAVVGDPVEENAQSVLVLPICARRPRGRARPGHERLEDVLHVSLPSIRRAGARPSK